MAKSMTGYGRSYIEKNGRGFQIEMKSVNNRYLDVNVKMPRQISYLEERVRKYITSNIQRGKIDVYINQDKFSDRDIKVSIDEEMAKAYYNALNSLKEMFGLKDNVSLQIMSRYSDIISIERKEDDEDEIWNTLEDCLNDAVGNLVSMKEREGERLSRDIYNRCDIINKDVIEIEALADKVVDEFREKIYERVSEYLKDVEVDQGRLLNEVAFFADRCSITEEIVRLKSHILQMKETVFSKDTIGKKLDFLIQEMNRETNTIGSKTSDLKITNLVVEIKSELEKIREQIQNIE